MSTTETLKTAISYLVKDENAQNYLLFLVEQDAEGRRKLSDVIHDLQEEWRKANNSVESHQIKINTLNKEINELVFGNHNPKFKKLELCRLELSLPGTYDPNRIKTIKEIRTGTGMGLQKATEVYNHLKQNGCSMVDGNKDYFASETTYVVLGA